MFRPRLSCLAVILVLAACEISRDEAKQDTATVAPEMAATETAAAAPPDTLSGVPAVPATSGGMAADSGVIRIAPERAQRGGVIAALVEGLAGGSTRCSWKGAPLPCYSAPGGVLALVPLPADEPAGRFTLTFEYPNRRLSRTIDVGERDFGRELIFLEDTLYRLVTRRSDIARDSRVLRRALSAETDRRRWSGRWRDPLSGSKSSGYGVERFYFRASDSTRAISLEPSMRASGPFALDTGTASSGDLPGWRHAGIDLTARRGTAVRAPASGTVVTVGSYTLTGRTLLLDHGQGVHTAYFHLDTVLVREGDEVDAGDAIARVGSTGLATGPHLHYGIYVHGKDVDPMAWSRLPEFARDTTPAARR